MHTLVVLAVACGSVSLLACDDPSNPSTKSDGGIDAGPGAVMGTRIDQHMIGADRVERAADLRASKTAVYVLDDDGVFTSHSGHGNEDGTFVVEDVPEGLLYVQNGEDYLVTHERQVQFGAYKLGRPNGTFPSARTPVRLDVANLPDPPGWEQWATAYLYSAEAGACHTQIETKAETSTLGPSRVQMLFDSNAASIKQPLIQANDHTLLGHLRPIATGGYTSYSLTNVFSTTAFGQTNGEESLLEGAFSAVTTRSMNLVWPLLHWSAPQALNALGPTGRVLAGTAQFGIAVVPGDTSYGAPEGFCFADLFAYPGPSQDKTLTFTATYGNPFSEQFGAFGYVFILYRTSYQVPGTQVPRTINGSMWYAATVDTFEQLSASGQPIKPVITRVVDPKIDDSGNPGAIRDLYDDQPLVGLTPRLFWDPPSEGDATGYVVRVHRLEATPAPEDPAITITTNVEIARIVTRASSLVLPPGLLEPSKRYAFVIRSVHMPNSSLERAAYASSFPEGYVEVFSGLITTLP
jgi:hypothetical protein